MAAFRVACASSVSGPCRVRSTRRSRSAMRRSIARIVGAILALGQARAEVSHQWIAQHLFDRTGRLFGRGAVPASRRAAQYDPICRPVTRAAKPRGIDEGLEPVDGMLIDAFPIGREP